MKAHTLVIPPRFKYDPSALLPLLVSPSSPPSPGLNGPLRKPIISSQGRFTKSFSSWPWPNMQSEAAPELSDSLSCFAPLPPAGGGRPPPIPGAATSPRSSQRLPPGGSEPSASPRFGPLLASGPGCPIPPRAPRGEGKSGQILGLLCYSPGRSISQPITPFLSFVAPPPPRK
jgi:hypothetical protein